jgi:phosphatidylserine/phosphatidylglycerophosphate/cardiolipin synthase-like enzyme
VLTNWIEAQRRGVDVRVILDKSQETEKYSSATFLLHAGIPTRIDAEHAIAHNKVMVLDDAVVLTGSFNFTASAESRNAENLLVIRDPQIARKYSTNWQDHWAHSLDYTGPKSGPEHTPSHRAENASPSWPPRGARS